MAAQVGQHYRDEDGATWRVVAFSKRGWPLLRNPNGKGFAIETNPAWLERWERTR